jgi:GNAT superfamily N-acetyltransferase
MSDTPSIDLRQATASDIPAILWLIGQPDMDNGDVLDIGAARAVFDKLATYPNYKLFVAELAGRIVGSYALLVMDNLGHLGAPSAIVEQVLVAPEAQGSGVGRAMMHHARNQARAARCYKLMLSSNIKRTRAHAFYDSLGFERHGISFRVDLPGDAAP